MTVGSSAVAREFAEVVDQVRKKEKIRRVGRQDVERGNKVNSAVTPFVEEIRMLEKGEGRAEKEEEAGGEVTEEKKRDLLSVLLPQREEASIKTF